MKCQEARSLFSAYLDHEDSLSERQAFQAHLAACEVCRLEFGALAATRARVSRSFKTQTAQAHLAPTAWKRLHSEVQRSAVPTPTGYLLMKPRFVIVTLVVLIAAFATAAFVPPVRAQVSQFFTLVFHSGSGGNEITMSTNLPMAFQALQPAYLPEPFNSGPQMINTRPDKLDTIYRTDDQFLVVSQSAAEGAALPAGEASQVNGQPAVVNRGISGAYQIPPMPAMPPDGSSAVMPQGASLSVVTGEGTVMSGGLITSMVQSGSASVMTNGLEDGPEFSGISGTVVVSGTGPAQGGIMVSGAAGSGPGVVSIGGAGIAPQVGVVSSLAQSETVPLPFQDVPFAGANRLTWIVEGTRIELTSTLPVEELLKIAAAMTPAR